MENVGGDQLIGTAAEQRTSRESHAGSIRVDKVKGGTVKVIIYLYHENARLRDKRIITKRDMG